MSSRKRKETSNSDSAVPPLKQATRPSKIQHASAQPPQDPFFTSKEDLDITLSHWNSLCGQNANNVPQHLKKLAIPSWLAATSVCIIFLITK